MKRLLAFAGCFLVTAALAFGQAANANLRPRHSTNPDAVLLFDDEFDGTSLNTTYWNQCYPESFRVGVAATIRASTWSGFGSTTCRWRMGI
jgi:hypothetical protein